MLRLLLIAVLISLCAAQAGAQTKLGGNPVYINADAYLELGDSIKANKGLLMPRVALRIPASPSPLHAHVAGMVVYNTATFGVAPNNVFPGIYYNSGNRWERLINATAGGFLQIRDSLVMYVTPAQIAAAMNQKLSIRDTALMLERYINSAFNGLSKSGQAVGLGGTLVMPTAISTSANNTMAITGLMLGTAVDSVVVSENTTGVLRKVSRGSLTSAAKAVYSAFTGQTLFNVVRPITDINKISLFRNGIRLDVIQVGAITVQLEPGVSCDANDEIKIIQLY